MNVVEVMSCGKTTDEVIARLFERLPAYGLLPYHVLKESVGFIYNRIWAAIKRESLAVVAEGVSTPQVVDQLFQTVLCCAATVRLSPIVRRCGIILFKRRREDSNKGREA